VKEGAGMEILSIARTIKLEQRLTDKNAIEEVPDAPGDE
jgi:hypothetical protein